MACSDDWVRHRSRYPGDLPVDRQPQSARAGRAAARLHRTRPIAARRAGRLHAKPAGGTAAGPIRQAARPRRRGQRRTEGIRREPQRGVLPLPPALLLRAQPGYRVGRAIPSPRCLGEFGRPASGSTALVAPLVMSPEGTVENTSRRLYTCVELIRQKISPANVSEDMAWLAGMFMLFDSSAYRRIGGFDERYFLYIEDVGHLFEASAVGPHDHPVRERAGRSRRAAPEPPFAAIHVLPPAGQCSGTGARRPSGCTAGSCTRSAALEFDRIRARVGARPTRTLSMFICRSRVPIHARPRVRFVRHPNSFAEGGARLLGRAIHDPASRGGISPACQIAAAGTIT